VPPRPAKKTASHSPVTLRTAPDASTEREAIKQLVGEYMLKSGTPRMNFRLDGTTVMVDGDQEIITKTVKKFSDRLELKI
jgi:allophanate hydrolase subunit 2